MYEQVKGFYHEPKHNVEAAFADCTIKHAALFHSAGVTTDSYYFLHVVERT